MAAERQSAKSARVCDLVGARFFQGDREKMTPNLVITGLGDSVSRARIVATVVEKFLSEDGRFASITVDDGTGAMRARVFADDSRIIEGIDVGDFVLVVGKMKNYNGENYVAPDFVRAIDDPNYEILFKLELLGDMSEKKKIASDIKSARDQMSDEELGGYAAEKYGIDHDTLQAIVQSEGAETDYKPLVLDVIGKLDEGGGVDIGKLLEASGLDESMAEGAINELLAEGEIYEPTVGKLRRVTA